LLTVTSNVLHVLRSHQFCAAGASVPELDTDMGQTGGQSAIRNVAFYWEVE